MKNKLSIFILSVLTLYFSSCSSDEKTIGLKQNIHHDDFEYSVQDVEKTASIGETKANGIFYIIAFKVQNDAKRVDHKWKNNIAYIVDASGKEYENDNHLQKLLNARNPFGYKDSYITGAGVTESTVFVFDLPADVKEPCLKVRGDFLMGDMFDGNQFKNTKVKLF